MEQTRPFPLFALIGALAIATVLLVLFSLGFLSSAERFFEDVLYQKTALSDKLVILDLDALPHADYAGGMLNRTVLGNILEQLQQFSPRIVGINYPLNVASPGSAHGDADLMRALSGATYQVVLAAQAADPSPLPSASFFEADISRPLSVFLQSKKVSVGHTAVLADSDHIVRSLPASLAARRLHKDDPYRQLEFLDSFSGVLISKLTDIGRANNSALDPVIPLWYAGPAGTVPEISAARLLSGDPAVHAALDNKIIIIGSARTPLYATPLSRSMSSSEIQAQAVNMLLGKKSLHTTPKYQIALRILLAAVIPVYVWWSIRRRIYALLVNIVIGGLYSVTFVLALRQGQSGNLLYLTLAWALSSMLLWFFHDTLLTEEVKN